MSPLAASRDEKASAEAISAREGAAEARVLAAMEGAQENASAVAKAKGAKMEKKAWRKDMDGLKKRGSGSTPLAETSIISRRKDRRRESPPQMVAGGVVWARKELDDFFSPDSHVFREIE